MKRLNRVRALFGFLRLKRDVLFDEEFQEQLYEMYRQTGAGDPPHPPAMMCMVLLLQGYVGASDAEAVELALMDLRWQMCLDCIGADEPSALAKKGPLLLTRTGPRRERRFGRLLVVGLGIAARRCRARVPFRGSCVRRPGNARRRQRTLTMASEISRPKMPLACEFC